MTVAESGALLMPALARAPAWPNLGTKPTSLWRRALTDPTLLAVAALSALTVVLVREMGGAMTHLGAWAYLGAFVVSAAGSATLLLPAPGGAAVLMMSPAFNPIWLGVAAGIGTALGSMTAYLVGARAAFSLKDGRRQTVIPRYFKRFGTPVLFLCNLVPLLPMDVAGLAAGAASFGAWRYLGLTMFASVLKMTGLVLGASALLGWVGR